MAIQPSDEVLERFGVRVVAPLGGRLNQHWLVEARRERLVLRRWSQSAGDIDYELRLLAQVAALGWPVAPALEAPIELDGHFWSLAPFLPGHPLEPEEWELLTPLWWAFLIDVTCQDMRNGIRDDGWTIRKLLQRSPLMGPDSAEFR